ncbi:MAG TPA: cell division protein ZapB [Candidatus Manganitrophaceae bacterium]
MAQEQLEVLESKIQEMIALIKRLKLEKEGLEAQVNLREKEFHQLQEERIKARSRIEKILGALNLLERDSGKGKTIE